MSSDPALNQPQQDRPADQENPDADDRLDELIVEYLKAVEAGETVDRAALLQRHPDLSEGLKEFFSDQDRMHRVVDPARRVLGDVPLAGNLPRQFGDYELLDEIARGGMGVVYRARQISLNRIVAVKMILAGRLASDDDVRRFRSEARAAAQLQHPHIVAIHEVGEIQGQHFFSMDYVDGISLAELVRENLLPAAEAAHILRSISDAIQYAHGKGILHRDLKPGNILMRRCEPDSGGSRLEGQADAREQQRNSIAGSRPASFANQAWTHPRVTDFGLAKQLEAASDLTGTGQVLGTPGYMPPEQAKGAGSGIGPASDVYSLGAILYEMLTGRPPFRAETPLDTVLQVLEAEPAPPRMLNPGVPRDLETICLKCLRKRAEQRYESAAALAADLDRFLAGESILARRPGLSERVIRWVSKQRRSVVTAIAAVAVSAILMIGGTIARLAYSTWQLGHVSMLTAAPSLTAEVLDRNDKLVVPRFAIPTQEPVSLQQGEYGLRLTGQSILSQTYQLLVERAVLQEFKIPDDHRVYWESVPVAGSYELWERADEKGGGADLILVDSTGIKRLEGKTRQLKWETRLGSQDQPLLAKFAGFTWDWSSKSTQRGRGFLDRRPQLVKPSRDLDQDGIRDLIWTGRHQAFVMAVSGASGKLLWCAVCNGQADPESVDLTSREGTILGSPVSWDVDGDGALDFVVTCAAVERDPGDQGGWARNPRRWVEAISGRTGKSLWILPFDGSWFLSSGTNVVPVACRWPTSRITWSMGGYSGTSGESVFCEHEFSLSGASEFSHVPFAVQRVQQGEQTILAGVAGSRLLCIEPRSGQLLWPARDLGYSPIRAPQFVDLNHDGFDEVLILRERPTGNKGWGRVMGTTLEAMALGPKDGALKTLFSDPLNASWNGFQWYDDPLDWPILEDTDNDVRPEIVVPHQFAEDAADRSWPWGGLKLIDGATGKTRWHVRLRSKHHQVDRFVVGPDIDGDGIKEIFAASTVAWLDDVNNFSLFVDALSGADGRTLWWRELRLGDSYGTCSGLGIGRLFWWNADDDGWPQLAIPYTANLDRGVPKTYFVSAGTGRVTFTSIGARDPRAVDLDGDGTLDFVDFRPEKLDTFDQGGKLYAVRGSTSAEWRRLGGNWMAAQDFNGDGTQDLIKPARNVTAISGADGSLLWQSKAYSFSFHCIPAPGGDLDNDGTSDVLVPYGHSGTIVSMGLCPLQAISGRTGQRLWSARQVRYFGGTQFLRCIDLDHDQKPEVVFLALMDRMSLTSAVGQWWLVVYSGATGEVRWQRPMSDRTSLGVADRGSPLQLDFADVNGDDTLDFVVPALTSRKQIELLALSGRDGAAIWQTAVPTPKDEFDLMNAMPHLRIADLDGDGSIEVVVSTYGPAAGSLRLLDAHNGNLRIELPCSGSRFPHERFLPKLARLEPRGFHVCLVESSPGNPSKKEILLLDRGGRVHDRRAIIHPYPPHDQQIVTVMDTDSDGIDELIFVDKGRLIATRRGLKDSVWEWPSTEDSARIMGVEPDEAGKPTTLVVRAGSQTLGIDGSTGQERWRYEGGAAAHERLRTARSPGVPLFVESTDELTTCMQATTAQGRPALEKHGQRSGHANREADPRLKRRLPWAHLALKTDMRIEIGLSVLVGIIGLVIPGSLIFSSIQRRRFSLQRAIWIMTAMGLLFGLLRLLASEAVDIAAYFPHLGGPLLSHRPPTSDALRNPVDLTLLALQGVLVLAFPAWIVRLITRRQWRRLVHWLTVAALVVAILAVIALAVDWRTRSPSEYYSWELWYWCLLPANFVCGAVLIISLFGRYLGRLMVGRAAKPFAA